MLLDVPFDDETRPGVLGYSVLGRCTENGFWGRFVFPVYKS